MSNIKIFEKTDSGWIEGLNFDYSVIGKSFTSKTLRFSPIGVDIADLRVRVEEKSDFIFTKSDDHLTSDYRSITPFKIMDGEMSNPVKIEFLIKSGPVRMDNLKIEFSYLEIPNNLED